MRTAALLTVLIIFNIASFSQQIQSVVNSTGNSFTKDYYSLDWSVGELSLVHTAQSSNGSVFITNGFLQPGHSNPYTSQNFTQDEIRILPNPTYDKVEINFLTTQQGAVKILVYDTYGRLLVARNVVCNGNGMIERVDLTRYAAGTYFLKINLDPYPGSVPKTGSYKIVKF